MTKNVSKESKHSRNQRSSEMNKDDPQWWKTRGLTPPSELPSPTIPSETNEGTVDLRTEDKLAACYVCGKYGRVARTVRAIERSIYFNEPQHVDKDICADCDTVPCFICGERTPSAVAKGFVEGTQPSEKRYTPPGVEDGATPGPQPPFNPSPIPSEDYAVTLKRVLVQGLHYYCPKCVEDYGVAGLPDAAYERHRVPRAYGGE